MARPRKLSDILSEPWEPKPEPYVTVKMSKSDPTMLCCPVSDCHFEYTHITDASIVEDDGQLALRLAAYCENGHEWDLRIRQHGGQTFIEASNMRAKIYNTPPEVNVEMNKVETLFWEAWHAHQSASHLWPLEPQVEYSTPGGNYRIDFGDPTVKYGIEIDGKAYHDGQEAFSRDRRRQNDLELEGWRFIRFAAIDVMNDVDDCVKRAITFFSNLDGGKP